MYELLRNLTLRQFSLEQLPIFLVALTIAEIFYKFHSFLLETGAFLVTWLVLGALFAGVQKLFEPNKTAPLLSPSQSSQSTTSSPLRFEQSE